MHNVIVYLMEQIMLIMQIIIPLMMSTYQMLSLFWVCLKVTWTKWWITFPYIFLKVNAEKCRLLFSVKVSIDDMQLSEITLGNGDRLSLLRVNKNNGLNLDYNVTHLWNKAC